MPSHPILTDSRKAAVEAVLDEVLAEVRAVSDATLLHECRSMFRSKVPLNLRAYVAAAMALRLTGSGSRQDNQKSRDGNRGRDADRSRGADRKRGEGATRQDGSKTAEEPAGRPLRAHEPRERELREDASQRQGGKPGRRGEHDKPKREPDLAAVDAAEARRGDEPEAREIRYRGEGVTLFVSAGRRQRFYSRVAVRVLSEAPGIQPEHIGDVRTMDNYCFIVVDPEVEEAAIAALNGLDFKGRILAANRARKKGEPAPAEAESSAAMDREPELDGSRGLDIGVLSDGEADTASEGFHESGEAAEYRDGDDGTDPDAGSADGSEERQG